MIIMIMIMLMIIVIIINFMTISYPYGGTINFKLRIQTDFSYLQAPVESTSEQCLAPMP